VNWYRSAFGARYLQVYAHRNDAEADRALDVTFGASELEGATVLDLACGAGRYLQSLSRRGARPLGLDLSPELLAEARSGLDLPLVRADMRHIPLADTSVDITLSMFTSFGYFEDDADHGRLALEMGRVTRHRIAVDVPNPVTLRRELVAESRREVDGLLVRETRWLETSPLRVCKSMELVDSLHEDRTERYEERVRLFTPDELLALFAAAGFRSDRILGDYTGAVFDPDSSPRTLVRFERESVS